MNEAPLPLPATAAAPALCIAVLGAESTGKTQLAQALAERLGAHTGLRCCWVPEYLRDWCLRHGRTPRADEQRGIARAQQALIDAAAADHALVVCDTTPLMTAVYSRVVFGDVSLDAEALAMQRRCGLSLLTALDLPWQPDGHLRDGPQVQQPVDDMLRRLLDQAGLPYTRIAGWGEARVQAALAAAWPAVAALALAAAPASAAETACTPPVSPGPR